MHDALPILQEELLEEAGNHVHRGGRLIYSTCSIEPEENWEQVQKFLSKFDNYELEKLDDFLPEEVLIEDGYAYQTFPHKHGCDGHFGVRMKRIRSEEHTSELQSRGHLVCRLLLEEKN